MSSDESSLWFICIIHLDEIWDKASEGDAHSIPDCEDAALVEPAPKPTVDIVAGTPTAANTNTEVVETRGRQRHRSNQRQSSRSRGPMDQFLTRTPSQKRPARTPPSAGLPSKQGKMPVTPPNSTDVSLQTATAEHGPSPPSKDQADAPSGKG